jgi:16S rRNA (guanine527-N7)-methyltransferase
MAENEKIKEFLHEGLKELGIEPGDSIISRFMIYIRELKKWSRAYNLTAIKEDRDIVIKHFLDSLLYLTAIPEGRWNICDIGSGAGFPGVPIAIVRPELNIVLNEPSRKKAAFLRHIKRMLSLDNVEVLECRVEDIRDRLFDIVVTRALFSIRDLIKKAGHILKRDGFFVLSKGPAEDEFKNVPDNIKCEVIAAVVLAGLLQRKIIKCRKKFDIVTDKNK